MDKPIRRTGYDRALRFVAINSLIPFAFSFANLTLYLFYFCAGGYESPDLTVGCLFWGFIGCWTAGLYMYAMHAKSRLASYLLGILYVSTSTLGLYTLVAEMGLNGLTWAGNDLSWLCIFFALCLGNLFAGCTLFVTTMRGWFPPDARRKA